MARYLVKFCLVVAAAVCSQTVSATAVLQVKGKVTSLTKTLAIVKGATSEYHIIIEKLNAADREKLTNAHAKKAAVELDLVAEQLEGAG